MSKNLEPKSPINVKVLQQVLKNIDYYISEKQFKIALLNTNYNLKNALFYIMTKSYLYAKLEVMLSEYDFGKDFAFIDTRRFANSVNQRLIAQVKNDELFQDTGANLWAPLIITAIVRMINKFLQKNYVYALKSISQTSLRMTNHMSMPDKRVRIMEIEDWIDEPWMLTQILENVVVEK